MRSNTCVFLSYVQYSTVAARAVRAALKSKDAQEAASKRGNTGYCAVLNFDRTLTFSDYQH